MENTIHRVVVSAYCTLMLSSAFLTVGDGMLLASAAAGFSAVETKVSQALSGLDDAGFAGAREWRPAAVQTAQGSAKLSPVGIPQLIAILRETGQAAKLDLDFVKYLGIPREPGEDGVPVKARARAHAQEQHMIAVPEEPGREYIVFSYEDEKRNESFYFYATAAGNLERAAVSDSKGVRRLSGPAAEAKYRSELAYWQELYRDKIQAPEPPEK